MERNQVFMAALACQAIGDALGDKFEFQHGIKFDDVAEHIRATTREGITDDTQMAYFGTRACIRILNGTPDTSVKVIQDEYLNWYKTQTRQPQQNIPKEMYKVRSPGNATMSSLSQLYACGERRVNDSHGCGSVMKLLPFMFMPLPIEHRLALAFKSAAVTHDGKQNKLAVFDYMIHAEDLLTKGGSARQHFPDRVVNVEKISDLGAGFYAQECVDMALYAVYHANSFYELLELSICHDGDSDSVAAVACSLWGMMTKEMPSPHLLKRVAEWPVLRDLAEDYITALDGATA